MNKANLNLVVLGLSALLGLAACNKAAEPAAEPAAAAAPASKPQIKTHPTFTLRDVDGVEHTLAEWDGRPRLLNFWATWCAPCRREIPLLKEVQAAQGDDGVQIIGIAVDFPEEVAAYSESVQFNYPILVGQEDAMAVAESSGVDFIGMPFTMILSADGELLDAHMGEIHRETIDAMVAILARLGRGEIDKAAARAALQSI